MKLLLTYIKEAMRLNEEGIKLPSRQKSPATTELQVPRYFMQALSKNKIAKKVFYAFSPSHKKEYVQWITEAKTEDTRNKRIAKAIEQMAEGKQMHWKHAKNN